VPAHKMRLSLVRRWLETLKTMASNGMIVKNNVSKSRPKKWREQFLFQFLLQSRAWTCVLVRILKASSHPLQQASSSESHGYGRGLPGLEKRWARAFRLT
jgi:hypothetical protein